MPIAFILLKLALYVSASFIHPLPMIFQYKTKETTMYPKKASMTLQNENIYNNIIFKKHILRNNVKANIPIHITLTCFLFKKAHQTITVN